MRHRSAVFFEKKTYVFISAARAGSARVMPWPWTIVAEIVKTSMLTTSNGVALSTNIESHMARKAACSVQSLVPSIGHTIEDA